MIDAESMIEKWDMKICELGEKNYTSSVPNANLNDSGTLNVLTNRGSGPKNVKFSNDNYTKSDMPESINS